ncbi:MAG: hypothetical protein JXB15_12460 [Anaerolineales bacterium]|nr:hypothetical protein [Anaerolineales bacterium]
MRSNTIFWGTILVLLGVLLLLSNMGIVTANIWGIIWPIGLILFGVWIILGLFLRRNLEVEQASIPLEGASQASVRIGHAAGRLQIGSGAGPGNLLDGEFGGGVEIDKKRQADTLGVRLNPSQTWSFPFAWSPGDTLNWSLRLTNEVPLGLELETGANDARVDLTELKVTSLRLSSGASSTDLTLPAVAGYTRVKISTGAASVKVRVPQGVAASIHYSSGLASVSVDKERFPRAERGYQSTDYDLAQNKVDIEIETGVGSVEIG